MRIFRRRSEQETPTKSERFQAALAAEGLCDVTFGDRALDEFMSAVSRDAAVEEFVEITRREARRQARERFFELASRHRKAEWRRLGRRRFATAS
jgi:hypothetical protein